MFLSFIFSYFGITSFSLFQYGNIIAIVLIGLLFLKEVFLSTEQWTKDVSSLFNLTIIPFFFIYIAIILFRIEELLQT